MSFFKTLKRGLGFGDDEDDPLYADPEEQAAEPSEVRSAAVAAPRVEVPAPEMTEDAKRAIFDHVVAVFNEAQPDFLRKALDPEAQSKYIYETLEQSLKDYLSELARQAQVRCEQQWQGEHSTMASEMESLREKAREVEQQRVDIQQRQLSADRQKRALADRVHDLEAQVAQLEAEREQYDLENKSLVNKLKVSGLHQEEADAMRSQVERLNRELAQLRDNPESAVAGLDAKLKEAADENAALSEALDNMREKQRVADEMIAQMRTQLKEKTRELDDANGMLGELEEIHAQMLKMDEVMKKREAKLARLKDKNARLEAQVEELSQKLARFSEPVPYAAAGETAGAVVGEPDETLKISDTDLSAMEETFESADWMSNEPPAASLSALSVRQPADDDSEFGYHEPKRRTPPADNCAQMSLF